LARPALLGVEVDQQDEVRHEGLERRLDGVVHLAVGMDGAASFDLLPRRLQRHAPRTRGRWRVAQEAALRARLEMEVVRGAMAEELEVLAVEVAHVELHAEIVGVDRHVPLPQPRRMTMAEPVPGMAQPRLAETSALRTWRQPPSR